MDFVLDLELSAFYPCLAIVLFLGPFYLATPSSYFEPSHLGGSTPNPILNLTFFWPIIPLC